MVNNKVLEQDIGNNTTQLLTIRDPGFLAPAKFA